VRQKISYPQKPPYKAVDKSEFFKWIKCFAYWLFSAQFFARLPGAPLQQRGFHYCAGVAEISNSPLSRSAASAFWYARPALESCVTNPPRVNPDPAASADSPAALLLRRGGKLLRLV
jgi:hypothetical protein